MPEAAGAWRVFVMPRAERDMRRLPKEILQRVRSAMRGLAGNPYPPGCAKVLGQERTLRIRIGDYRVLYDVDDVERVVIVLRVRLRGEAYRD